jgi:WD40-like Beta Propeller Repeat
VPGSRRILSRPPRRCARRYPYWSDERPSWSRDGNWIAYVHVDDCRGRAVRQVRVVHPDGTGMRIVRRLGADAPGAHHPVFTPDGRRLLLTIGHSRVWVLGSGSGRRVRVLRFPKGRSVRVLGYPVFAQSPDGRTATLLRPPSARGRPNELAGIGLFAGRFGGGWRRLTRAPETRQVAAYDTEPDWHPSGGP